MFFQLKVEYTKLLLNIYNAMFCRRYAFNAAKLHHFFFVKPIKKTIFTKIKIKWRIN